jgi:hypothetical protein
MAHGSRAIFRFPYFLAFGRKPLARAAQACIFGGLPAILAGCSMALPISPLLSPDAKEDKAGAVEKSSLASLLDAEDWRRAKAALSTALDPQGNGSLVGWDNPDSGNKGRLIHSGRQTLPLGDRDLPRLSREGR